MVYLNMTLIHSKGQGQAHFNLNTLQRVTDRSNIAIADKQEVACDLSIALFIFDQWPWPILKVKVMHIATVNISKWMTDTANITIA